MAADDTTVSWIAAANNAVKLAKNAAEAQRQIVDLEDAQANLSRLVTEFRKLSDGANIVRALGWGGCSPSADLLRDLDDASTTLDSRPLNRTVRHLERFQTEVRSTLMDRWGQHVAEQIGDVSELLVLAQTLSVVDGLGDLSDRLQTTLRALAGIQRSLPSPRALELLQSAKEALHALEKALQPDSVRRFLSAVGRGGAATNLLTTDVTDWLASHNALNSFKIVAGNPTGEIDV